MNINFNNIILNKEQFNLDNLVINNQNFKDFINVNYKNSVYLIEGLFFETEWTKLINNYYILEKNNKYIIELPFIENSCILKIIENIDNKFNEYVSKINNNNIFVSNVKTNYLSKYNFTYQFIKLKLYLNNCKIYLDGKEYNKAFEEIDFQKLDVKFQISTHGIWKYNNKYGFSWRIVKIFLKSNKINNIQYFINKKYIQDNTYIDINNNFTNNSMECLNFKIPNFELEFDM